MRAQNTAGRAAKTVWPPEQRKDSTGTSGGGQRGWGGGWGRVGGSGVQGSVGQGWQG